MAIVVAFNTKHATLVQRPEMVQRRSARFVLRNYKGMSSVGDMLDQLVWKSLQSKRTMRLCMLYKLHYGLVATDGCRY